MGFKKTLASIVLAGAMALGIGSKANAEIVPYNFDFTNYEAGLINGRDNWQSEDTLDNRGWEIINLYDNKNALTFNPISDFENFSLEDNHAIYHLHTNQKIDNTIPEFGGHHSIRWGSIFEICLSKDSSNWIRICYNDGGELGDVSIGWMGWNRIVPDLDRDLYIKFSAGAHSNIWYQTFVSDFYINLDVIPEPATLGLLALGGLGVFASKKRKV